MTLWHVGAIGSTEIGDGNQVRLDGLDFFFKLTGKVIESRKLRARRRQKTATSEEVHRRASRLAGPASLRQTITKSGHAERNREGPPIGTAGSGERGNQSVATEKDKEKSTDLKVGHYESQIPHVTRNGV